MTARDQAFSDPTRRLTRARARGPIALPLFCMLNAGAGEAGRQVATLSGVKEVSVRGTNQRT